MRNRLLFVAAVFSLIDSSHAQEPTSSTQTPAAASNSVLKLADATPVFLRTNQRVSSASAKVGDRVPFRVAQNVKVGELIVIRRGAEAWGVVTAVQQKARKGRAGSIDVAIQSTQLLTGQPAPLRAVQHSQGAGRSMGQDALQAAGESGGILLPLLPLVMLEKGGDAVLPANAKITAYLKGDVPLDQSELERVQPPVVHRTGPATITVYRTDGWRGYVPDLYCGKILVGWVWVGHYLKFQLPPGKYFLDANAHQVFELPLEEGQEVYLVVQGDIHGLGIKWHFAQVPNEEGEDAIDNFSEMDRKRMVKLSSVSLADLQAMPVKK